VDSNKETQRINNQPIELIKAKEFLTVRDVCQLFFYQEFVILLAADNFTFSS